MKPPSGEATHLTPPSRGPNEEQRRPAPRGRGALGVMIEDTSEGVRIAKAISGGAADEAGIKAGDIVIGFNGIPISESAQLRELAGNGGIGAPVLVRVRRSMTTLDLHAVLQRAGPDASPGATARAAENGEPRSARPTLAPEDEQFVDLKGGWGWSDRCLGHLKAGMLGWAKAACERGLEQEPGSPNPRPALLYNLGLIAKQSGDTASARRYFEQSLLLREHPEVRSALDSLP